MLNIKSKKTIFNVAIGKISFTHVAYIIFLLDCAALGYN